MPKQMYSSQLKSLYLSLFLSTLCLAYADFGQQLLETPIIFGGLLIAIVLAYFMEGKAYLSIQKSNMVAVVVVGASLAWLLLTFTINSDEDASVAATRTVLGRVGPLLSLLMLAKLFRPKEASDQWLLHLLAFVQILLACAITMQLRSRDTVFFPMLLLGYLLCLTWSLRWFFLGRELEVDTLGDRILPSPQVRWRGILVLFVLGIALTFIILLSFPQFFDLNSEFSSKDEVGFNSVADLNGDGELDVSNEQVLTIQLRGKNIPRDYELPEDFRLRGSVCTNYTRDGVWVPVDRQMAGSILFPKASNVEMSGIYGMQIHIEQDNTKVRDTGPKNTPFFSRNAGEFKGPLFLADPPRFPTEKFVFAFDGLSDTGERHTIPSVNSEFQAEVTTSQKKKLSYLQPFSPEYSKNGEWIQVFRFSTDAFTESQNKSRNKSEQRDYFRNLRQIPSNITGSKAPGQSNYRIKEVALAALKAANLSEKSTPAEKAKALEAYLMKSDFKYSLERKRVDEKLDPTEDFLINVKEGHCQRYASALALMLRSIDVPCRVVIGFRGIENMFSGVYVVRQSNAHAWVEAVIRTNLNDNLALDERHQITWLTLDPSPQENIGVEVSKLAQQMNFFKFVWEFFILDLTGQSQRAKLMALARNSALGDLFLYWQSLPPWLAWTMVIGLVLLFAAVGAILFMLFRKWYNRRTQLQGMMSTGNYPAFNSMMKLLYKLGWQKVPSDTPAEYAQASGDKLRQNELTQPVSNIPTSVVQSFYDARYGGRSIPVEKEAELQKEVEKLREATRRG